MRKRPSRIEGAHLIRLTDKTANTVGDLVPKNTRGGFNLHALSMAGAAAPVYWMVPAGGVSFEILSYDADVKLGYSTRYLRKVLRTLKYWGFVTIEDGRGRRKRVVH